MQVRVKDVAGNIGSDGEAWVTSKAYTVKLDRNVGTLSVTGTLTDEEGTETPFASGTWTNKNIHFQLTYTPQGGAQTSGVTYEIKIGKDSTAQWKPVTELLAADGYQWNENTNTLTIIGDHSEDIQFRVTTESGLSTSAVPGEGQYYEVRQTQTPLNEVTATFTDGEQSNYDNWWYEGSNGNYADTVPTITIPLNKAPEGHAPITTVYKYWPASLGTDEPAEGTDGVVVKKWTAAESAAEASFSFPDTDAPQGQYYYMVWQEDEAGNKSTSVTQLVKVDTVDPTVETAGYRINENSEFKNFVRKLTFGIFFNEEIEVLIPVEDTNSQMASLTYKLSQTADGTDAHLETISAGDFVQFTDAQGKGKTAASIKLPLGTKAYISYTAMDNAGNQTDEKKLLTDGKDNLLIVENGAPVFVEPVISGDQKAPDTNWYTGDVTVKTVVTDVAGTGENSEAVSGLANITYVIGNEPNQKTGTYKEYKNALTVSDTFNGEDASKVLVDFDGAGIPVTVRAKDNAGNSSEKTVHVDVDRTPPVIKSGAGNATVLKTPTNELTRSLTFTIDDVTSGLQGVKVGLTQTGPNPPYEDVTGQLKENPDSQEYELTISKNGHYKVTATDNAGNIQLYTFDVNIFDRLAPEIKEVHLEPKAVNGIYNEKETFIHIDKIDNIDPSGGYCSELDYYQFAVSETKGITDSTLLKWSENCYNEDGKRGKLTETGYWYLYILQYDKAGNAKIYEYPEMITIDNGLPNITVTNDEYFGNTTEGPWTNKPVEIDIKSVADTTLDGAAYQVKEPNHENWTEISLASDQEGTVLLDTGSWTNSPIEGDETGKAKMTHTFTAMPEEAEGVLQYQFKVVKLSDKQEQSSGTYTVKLDETAPRTPIANVAAEEESGWYTTAPTLNLEVQKTDAEGNQIESNNTAPVTIWYKKWMKGTDEPTDGIPAGETVELSITDGITYVKYWAQDEAGNISKSETKEFKVDTQAPAIVETITVEPVDSALGTIVNQIFGNFFKGDLKVTVKISESGVSGIDKLTYTLANADGSKSVEAEATLNDAKTEATFTLPVKEIDHKKLSVTLYDRAGNKNGPREVTGNGSSSIWTVENSAPAIQVAITDTENKELTSNNAGWYNKEVKLTATVTDSSGLRTVEWDKSVNGAPGNRENIFTVSNTEEDSPELASQIISDNSGNIVVTYYAEDNATNTSNEPVKLKIDTVAPEIKNLTGIPEDWSNAETTTLTFDASDITSGVKYGEIKVEKGTAGSTEAEFTPDGSVPIDVRYPSESSQDSALSYSGMEFDITENGVYRITVRDVAGNIKTEVFTVDKIDTIAPTAPSVRKSPETPGEGKEWYITIPELIVTEADYNGEEGELESNSSKVSTIYQLWKTDEPVNDANPKAPEGTKEVVYSESTKPVIKGSGYWHIKIWGEDAAGNITPENTISDIKVDVDEPDVDMGNILYNEKNANAVAEFLNWLSFGNFFNKQLEVKIPVTDKGYSGVGRLRYKLVPNNGSPETISFKDADLVELSEMANGEQTAYAKIILNIGYEGSVIFDVYDKAGNAKTDPDTGLPHVMELSGLSGYNIWIGDEEQPQISVNESYLGNKNDAGWYNKPVNLTFTVQDYPMDSDKPNAGINQISWDGILLNNSVAGLDFLNADGIASRRDSQAIFTRTASKQGENTYTVGAKDNALNEAKPLDVTLKIDTVAPVSSYPNGAPDLNTPTSESIPVTIRVTDATSKVVEDSIILKDAEGTIVSENPGNPAKIEGWTITPIESETENVSKVYEITFKIAVNGTYTLEAKDRADNVMVTNEGANSANKWVVENINKSAVAKPTVAVNENGEPGTNNWFNTNPTTLTITNKEGALKTMSYALKTGTDAPDEAEYKPLSFNFPDEENKIGVAANEKPPIITDGKYTLYLKVVQDTGKSAAFKYQINVDTNAPDITVTGNDWTTWVTKEQIIHFSITDAEAEASTVMEDSIVLKKGNAPLTKVETKPTEEDGLAVGTYFIEPNEKGGFKGYFKTNGNGTYTIAASDVAGNAFAEGSKEYKEIIVSNIDTDAPAPAPEIKATAEATGNKVENVADKKWYTQIPTLDWTTAKLNTEEATEGTPGTSEVTSTYEKYEGTDISGTAKETFEFTNDVDKKTPTVEDGIWTFKTWAEDEAGHNKDQKTVDVSTYWVDATKPTIAVAYNPDVTTSGKVTITVTLKDVTSKIDKDSLTVTKVDGMDVPADLNLMQGDDETTYQFTIEVDKNSEYTINVKDKAGNAADSATAKVTWIDTSIMPIAPVMYGSKQLNPETTVGWYKEPVNKVTVEKAESTETAQIHTTVTVTKPDGTEEKRELQDGKTTSTEFTLNQDGIWKIQTYSEKQVTPVTEVDKRTDTYTIMVDTKAPDIDDASKITITNDKDTLNGKDNWTNGLQTVTFRVTDSPKNPAGTENEKEVSGVKTVTVTTKDGAFGDGKTSPLTLKPNDDDSYSFKASKNGTYTINAWDAAKADEVAEAPDGGNKADPVELKIDHIDTTKPADITESNVDVEGSREDGNDWYKEKLPTITITGPGNDGGAPLEVWWKLEHKATDETLDEEYQEIGMAQYGDDADNNEQIPELTMDGVYRLTVWTEDEAGNRSATDFVEVIKVDTKAPEPVAENGIIIEPTGSNPLEKIGNFLTFGNFFKEELKVTVTAEDATSGTLYLYYGVDAVGDGFVENTDQKRREMLDGKASFEIPDYGTPGVRKAKFTLKDKAGNYSGVILVKGDKGSKDWIIEARSPEITDFKATSNSNSVGWYNTSVNFTATVTDTESYLNKVDWIVSGDAEKALNKQEGDATHNLFTRWENAPAGEPSFTVDQTITVDGQTTVDIAAEDNALNVATLSNAQPDAVRTIKIDTKKPVIQYVSGNPDKWTSKEQTITFTVTDTPKTEGILHSGVDDDTVTVDFKKSSGNQDAEEGELDLLSREQNGNTWTYTFQTRGNGTYTFTAMDIAGNAAEKVTITVDKINSTNLEAPGTDEKGNRGYVKWNEHTGEDYKDSSDSVIGWYANGKNPEITIRNSHAGPDDMPIYTVYKLWNTANNEPEMFKQIGFDESSLNPKTVTITDGINWTDGTWKLAAWNIPAAGAPSPRAEWTFMVDNTAPTVSETPEELKEINTDGWQKLINKLTFGLFYKEAIQVTVQVEDATSHGETLYYQIETEKDGKQELVTGDAKIRLTNDNSTIGYAKFTLPIGTKGKIAMWAEDFAGNVSAKLDEQNNLIPESGQVYLGYNGATWWELENTAPVITEISPVMDEKDVSVYLQGIVLTFNERVTAAEGKTVTISTGGEYYDYTLTEEDTKQIYLASPANAGMDMDTPENVHGTYKVTLPINKFAERTTGESLSLSYNTDYIIRAEKGAFLDLATNEQVGGVYSVFTTEDDSKAEVPTIADLDVTGGQFIQIYPEFSSDNTEYVIVVADGALNEDKTQLAQDLILKAALTGDVELTEAVLKNFMGVTIDDDLSIQDTAAGSNVIVSADLIQAKENYILQLTISDHGKEQTYTFYVSTSAVTASTDYLTSGMPKVQVDTDELLVSLANEDLAQYLQKGLKVNIRMDISAPSLDSIPEEEAAFNALRTAMGEVEKHITYYPFDFTIWKAVSNGEMEKITRLREPITITIPIPSRIDLEDFRDVYRYHDGVPYKVQFTLNEAARTVTFEADEFSVYALAYYKEPSYSGGGGGGGGGGTGGGGGGGVVNVGSQVAYYGGAWQNDGWMFIKSDGTKPVNEWLNIDGKIYRFGLDGFMTTSFEKYQFNNDGSLAPASAAVVKAQVPIATGTWLRDGWRYKTLSKTYLSGGWYYLYYNGLFDWYYFNDEGWMLDGWFAYGGETYYLHTTHDWSRGRMYMGWQVIDGKWYYFRMKADGKEGTLMRNSYTPDGHFVGADGAWDGRGSAPTAYVRK